MNTTKQLRSIRWKLPLTYAAIALIAALSLGAVLLVVVNQYYGEQQRDFLENSADFLSRIISVNIANKPDLSEEELKSQLERLSVMSGVRVALHNPNGTVLVDSGLPKRWLITSEPLSGTWTQAVPAQGGDFTIEVASRSAPFPFNILDFFIRELRTAVYPHSASATTAADQFASVEALSVIPLPDADNMLFTQSSDQIFFNVRMPDSNQQAQMMGIPVMPSFFGIQPVRDTDGQNFVREIPRSDFAATAPLRVMGRGWGGQYLRISDGLNLSEEVINSVARGWIVASAFAVLLAGGVGWVVSHHISAPLVALTAATTQMMHGDLSVRTDINRHDEIGTLAETFNDMAARVENTVNALRHFVADAAHEIHTPLTALRTNLELICEAPDLQSAQRALQQVNRLQSLADDLLDLSRLEASGSSDQNGAKIVQDVDLGAMVCEVSEQYASRAEQADIDYVLKVAENTETHIPANPTQLRRALSNLLDNAIKFTPAGGEVTVTLQTNGNWADIIVEDTGIGIPEADLPQLFSRFKRGRNTANYPGSGLGLAIVKAIAEVHHGSVDVLCCEHGTQFVLRLPITPKNQPKVAKSFTPDYETVIAS